MVLPPPWFKRATTRAGSDAILRTAAHASHWLQSRGRSLIDLDANQVGEFKQHLAVCRCLGFQRTEARRTRGAELFLQHLQDSGFIAKPAPQAQPPLFAGFCRWMRQHRGAKDATLDAYGRIILDALQTLREDPRRFDAASLRAFVLDRARRHSISKAKLVVTALRAFVRYLVAQQCCQVGLDAAIPTVAGWHLAVLPRYLPAADVERVLSACDPATIAGARDRAVLLLLSRLGLRAGDVCNLRLRDIDWAQATIQVMGKSSIVRRAIKRAGVSAPAHGAHVLRNSAATSLLAQGASLQSIAVLLRHCSLDTTTLYAKVDVKVLRQLARPWPEIQPC